MFRGTVFRDWLSRGRTTAFVRAGFWLLAALADGLMITISAVVAGVGYHSFFYHVGGVAADFSEVGVLLAALFIVLNVLRHEYEISVYLNFAGHARRAFLVWNIAFLTVLVFVFVTKKTADYSRASTILFYCLGLVSIICTRAFVVAKVKRNAVLGRISAMRVVLVGEEAEIRDFTGRYTPWLSGVDIIASFVLRGKETLDDDIALAAASARILKPDDIFILLPWSDTQIIQTAIKAFVNVPASIHLGPQRVLDHFTNVSVSRVGQVYSLHLVRRPLTIVDVAVKRAFDLLLGIPILFCLLPVFALIAIAIRLESKGPVFFLQRRYGFNQETFRIVKFRSMRVAEDGTMVRSATRNDPRVTRIGRFMRRYNIDELPQLLNVLRGEMSLVGPRPHALVHNQHFERSIADYARRHNVKPGITGWAQIHGLRGEVTSEDLMRRRVEHDLYYIDNWSVGLDLRVLAMTLLSPQAFQNAY